jgi:4-hydroxybenzoate polyprenyltransferase
MTTLLAFLENLRPRQWTKNLLLLAGVIFAQKLGDTACLTRAVLGVVVFCFASGVVYVFNDLADLDLDRRHPYKRHRPIASGRLPVGQAVRLGLVLLLLCLVAAFLMGSLFMGGVLFFFIWNWIYTRWLKRVPILDVSGIGMSFVIRATCGVLVLLPACPDVNISPWLLFCTFFLSMFLGFGKRRDELLKIQPEKGETRPVLRGYSEPMINAMIGLSLAMTTMMYSMYTIWPSTVAHFGTRDLLFTIPFVLAGLGRYTYLVYREARGGRPHEILLNDFALQVIVIGWVGAAIYIIGV